MDVFMFVKKFICIFRYCPDILSIYFLRESKWSRRIRNHPPQLIYINCRNHCLALCFKHIWDEFPWLKTINSLLLGLWKALHFSTKNRYILNEIQTGYSVKTLNVIKATVTRRLSHAAACKRTREKCPIIIESLYDITNDPKAELTGLCDQMLNSEILLQICFLEDVLRITNILSLLLQSDKKILLLFAGLYS